MCSLLLEMQKCLYSLKPWGLLELPWGPVWVPLVVLGKPVIALGASAVFCTSLQAFSGHLALLVAPFSEPRGVLQWPPWGPYLGPLWGPRSVTLFFDAAVPNHVGCPWGTLQLLWVPHGPLQGALVVPRGPHVGPSAVVVMLPLGPWELFVCTPPTILRPVLLSGTTANIHPSHIMAMFA